MTLRLSTQRHPTAPPSSPGPMGFGFGGAAEIAHDVADVEADDGIARRASPPKLFIAQTSLFGAPSSPGGEAS